MTPTTTEPQTTSLPAPIAMPRPLAAIEADMLAVRKDKESLTRAKLKAKKEGRMADFWTLGDKEANAQQVFSALLIEAKNAGKVW